MHAVSRQQLTGKVTDLHTVYGGLASGRMVITGSPGAGKSGATVMLLLAALEHREQVSDSDRPRVPVPVMFTMHDWDPVTEPVSSWVAGRMLRTYPIVASRGRTSALVASGKIAVVLDGLDEIAEPLRPVALQALSRQATFRLVVVTMSSELAAAAVQGMVEGAVALELLDVDPEGAARYLTRIQLDPASSEWDELIGRLHRDPRCPLAKTLRNLWVPITLS